LSGAMKLETALEKRRLTILKGISQDLKYSEIAAQLGINRWTLLNDVRLMRRNRGPGLRDAENARDAIRTEKSMRLKAERVYVKQEELFLSMTGMTLQEKTFRNMIDFYRSELMAMMKAEDQGDAIMVLPKVDRRTMLHNGILNGRRGSYTSWNITERVKNYLAIT